MGLEPYDEGDADWFVGREGEIAQVQTLVQDFPFVLLTGYSGVGKTSLIRAGLLPRWRADGWHCAYLALQDLFAPGQAAPNADGATRILRDLLDELVGETSPPGATFNSAFERLAGRYADTTILIAFDGFELLSRRGSPDLANGLYQALAETVAGRWPNLRVLLAYRGDAEPDVGPPLQRVAGVMGGPPRFYLLPLSSDAAVGILRAGLQSTGVTLGDDDPVPAILDELESMVRGRSSAVGGQDAPPAIYPYRLQMVGQTLSQRAGENDGLLTMDLCEELGGVQSILDEYLSRQLERFGERRAEAEKVLVALVRHGRQRERGLQDSTGLRAELAAADWSRLLADLAAAHLVRLSDAPLGGRQVEVVHELLADMIQRETVRQERELRRLRGTLALRAAAMEEGPVFMRSDVMAELYLWRERILPSPMELRLLLYNGLAGHGPAWYWLRKMPPVELRALFKQAFEHSSPELHRAGGLALAAAATQEEVLTLRTLLEDQDPQVRVAAARALVEIVPDMGWDDALLLRFLIQAPDPTVQRAAADGLVRVLAQVGHSIVPELPTLLRDDEPQVRYIAEQTLARVARREDIPLLRRMLQDQDLDVLNAAWSTLTQVLARTPRQELDELRALLGDEDLYVQGAAREALTQMVGQMGSEDEPLLRELSQSEDPNVRHDAALALVRVLAVRGPVAIADLRPMLDDWNADVRHAASRALADALAQLAQQDDAAGDAADPLAELRAMMDSPDRPLRVAFAQAVTRLLARQGRESIPELQELLDDADPDVRHAARHALEEVLAQVGREAIPDLQAMLEDPNWDVWQVAGLALARVLSELGRGGLRELRLLLKEGEDPEVRRAGGQALAGVLRDLGRVSLPELRRMLQDENEQVRWAAGRALAQVLDDSGARGLSDLRWLLQNEDSQIQDFARQALTSVASRMGRESLSVLRDMLADDSPVVRDAAQESLRHVAQQLGRQTIPYLREMLHDRHASTRHAAALTIAALDPLRGLQAWSELVVIYPLDNEHATQALVTLDRGLYCPFAAAWAVRVESDEPSVGTGKPAGEIWYT